MKRNDLLTGEGFYPSRITQKFASARNRIKYHNNKANKLRHSVMFVNTPLQRNLRILNELMKEKEKATFHKQYLLGKGYSFDVLTHFQSLEGKRMACVYHYAILLEDNENVLFRRLKNINE